MPELPEVEVVRRGLATHLGGRRIEGVSVLHPRPVRTHPFGPDGFVASLTGRPVDDIRRRGKYLWLPLDDTDALAMVDRGLKAISGDRAGLKVQRGRNDGVRGFDLRLGRHLTISASR